MNSTIKTCRRLQRGGVLLEFVLALGMVMAAVLLLGQWLTSAGHQRRLAEQRRIAHQELANRMERVALLPWERLTADEIEKSPLGRHVSNVLRGAALDVEVTEEAEPVAARRIELRLTWQNAAGSELAPVSLMAWRYDQEAAP